MSNPTPPRWLKPANQLVRMLNKVGIPAGPAYVLTVPGRKSGEPRHTPITPFDLDGRLYAVAGYPGSQWGRNARAAGSGTLARGRTSHPVTIVEVSADEARRALRAFAVKVPVGVGFAKRSGLVRAGTPDEFEALAGRLIVFRFDR